MGRMGRMGVSLSMELIFSELCEFSVKYWFCVGCGGFEEGSKRDRRRGVEGRVFKLKIEKRKLLSRQNRDTHYKSVCDATESFMGLMGRMG